MKSYLTLIVVSLSFFSFTSFNFEIGQVIDRYYDVPVFYNGHNYRNVIGRNVTHDGYNLGLKYQCVEYVKRFYYEVYNHKMPNSYGHAKELFDNSLPDVAFNEERGLMQYRNTRNERPKEGDILVYGASNSNPFGHTGILCEVTNEHVVLIQQNYGLKSRQKINLAEFQGIFTVADYNVLGWLRYQ